MHSGTQSKGVCASNCPGAMWGHSPLPRVWGGFSRRGWAWFPPPTPTNKGLNLKLQQEACRLDFREAQRV